MNPYDSAKVNSLRSALAPVISTMVGKIQAVYLHGSWGTESERKESDVDLAILADARLSLEEMSAIFSEAYKSFQGERNIDMAELFGANCIFTAQVVTNGERLMVLDRNAADRFEMIALAKYARLNEERAGIVSAIQQRGTVYLTSVAA